MEHLGLGKSSTIILLEDLPQTLSAIAISKFSPYNFTETMTKCNMSTYEDLGNKQRLFLFDRS